MNDSIINGISSSSPYVKNNEGEPQLFLHGTNATFSNFERGHNITAKHFYFTRSEDVAKFYGKNIVKAFLKGKVADLTEDNMNYSLIQKIFTDIGDDLGYEDADSFYDFVTSGRMYNDSGSQRAQNYILSEIFGYGYDIVKFYDISGESEDYISYVVDDPENIEVVTG